jgi:protein-S-isoprenylcysteine O-methyltransferase Ste14
LYELLESNLLIEWSNDSVPLYCYIFVVVGVLLWLAPFVRTGWSSSATRNVDRRSRWGLVLQLVGYTLMLQGRFWAVTPRLWQVLASLLCFVLAIALSWTATRALGREHLRFDAAIGAEHELVRSGPYRVVRHPIYTSMLCVLFGIGFIAASPLLFAIATLVFLVGTEIRVRIEDHLLAAHFGEQFEQYRRSTRAYLPLLR